jgi:chromosome segregation ATPase
LFPPRRQPLSKAWTSTLDGALAEAKKNHLQSSQSPPVIPATNPVQIAEERASKAEIELRQALDEVASLKFRLESTEAAAAKAHTSCEEKLKKYDADLVYSGQTAASLRRQLSDAIEEKVRAVAMAEQVSKQEQSYKTVIAKLQSGIEVAQQRSTDLHIELKTTKEDLANISQSFNDVTSSSSKQIAELNSSLSEANAIIQDQSARISVLQEECKNKEDALSSASANITSWTELCSGLKRNIDELRIAESAVREAARVEVVEAASKVDIAENHVQQMQTECCAALKASAEAASVAAAQAKLDSIALKSAQAVVRELEETASALRRELEDLRGIELRFEAETVSRIALEKKCAAIEASSSERSAISEECELLKGQLQRAILSANASASAKDLLNAEVENLSSQLQRTQDENTANFFAVQQKCDSLQTLLAQANAREKESAVIKEVQMSQLAQSASAVFQQKEEIASLRSVLDESKAQITQLNEHLEGLREHIAKSAQARVIQEEAHSALCDELVALQNENRQLKAVVAAFESDQATLIVLNAQNKRLEDDKKILQGQVDLLIESSRMALSADKARATAQAQVESSIADTQHYKSQLDEMQIRLDEAMEATASLVSQAENVSLENAILKDQVISLIDCLQFFSTTQLKVFCRSYSCLLQRLPQKMMRLILPAS